MSTGLNCEFVEDTNGKWFYVLENWSSPKGAWDWRDDATATGPFDTEDEARTYLRDNEANPGGSSTIPYDPAHGLDATTQSLIRNAVKPRPSLTRHPYHYRW